MKRRCRADIIAKILESALSGEIKTNIMMHAHLNPRQIQRYIPLVLSGGLIEERHDRLSSYLRTYVTTVKGRLYLQKYSVLVLNRNKDYEQTSLTGIQKPNRD
jgi:predicted transcriptional regulator